MHAYVRGCTCIGRDLKETVFLGNITWSAMGKQNIQAKKSIKRFHSRRQHLCKFIGTKESVCIRKSSTPTGLVWYTNMAAVSLFRNYNMAAVTSCENALLFRRDRSSLPKVL